MDIGRGADSGDLHLMPASADEQRRLDRLALLHQESAGETESPAAITPGFLYKMVAGFIRIRDELDGTKARTSALEEDVATLSARLETLERLP